MVLPQLKVKRGNENENIKRSEKKCLETVAPTIVIIGRIFLKHCQKRTRGKKENENVNIPSF